MKPIILVVDDEENHRLMLRAHLQADGFRVQEAADGREAVEAVAERLFDLILLDVRMPGMDGMDALREIMRMSPGTPVIMMTAYGSIDSAVAALKEGAEDYLTKPLDADELLIRVRKVLDVKRLREENILQREALGQRFDFASIVGSGPKMLAFFETLSLVSPSDATVLLLGESGTGKEVVARAIHRNSPRRDKSLVKVSCAALPETLLESELFGHERGAFTGAVSRKRGRFELAHQGTLFLDEIGEMALSTQAKLLRVLQEREFEPLGSERTVKVDVRIIAATNRDLEGEVARGGFREDLYWRLNVVTATLPPLRERREDIPLLAEHFLKVYVEKNRKMVQGFTPGAMNLFLRYGWPGNVRELENVVERGVILSRGDRIGLDALPPQLQELAGAEGEGPEIRVGLSLRDVEKEMIIQTLRETGGNRTQASAILGITRKTLLNKIKEYGIQG
jgi:two-component system, NtrC family, response regulator HydG